MEGRWEELEDCVRWLEGSLVRDGGDNGCVGKLVGIWGRFGGNEGGGGGGLLRWCALSGFGVKGMEWGVRGICGEQGGVG